MNRHFSRRFRTFDVTFLPSPSRLPTRVSAGKPICRIVRGTRPPEAALLSDLCHGQPTHLPPLLFFHPSPIFLFSLTRSRFLQNTTHRLTDRIGKFSRSTFDDDTTLVYTNGQGRKVKGWKKKKEEMAMTFERGARIRIDRSAGSESGKKNSSRFPFCCDRARS